MDVKTPETAGGYDEATFSKLFAVEDRHFWFRSRNILIAELAKRALAGVESPLILEIGCGNGNVLAALDRACTGSRVIGLDFQSEGLKYARMRCSLPLVQADANHPPFSTPFDLIGMFDVLEHIGDDAEALESANRLLRLGGKFLLTVPSGMELWSYADIAARHCRRYDIPELTQKLAAAGFRLEFVTSFMASLYPVLRLWRMFNQSADKSEADLFERDLKVIPVVNEAAAWLTTREAHWVAAGRRLPFGTSLVALAVKER